MVLLDVVYVPWKPVRFVCTLWDMSRVGCSKPTVVGVGPSAGSRLKIRPFSYAWDQINGMLARVLGFPDKRHTNLAPLRDVPIRASYFQMSPKIALYEGQKRPQEAGTRVQIEP
jgi:hypothetical protein